MLSDGYIHHFVASYVHYVSSNVKPYPLSPLVGIFGPKIINSFERAHHFEVFGAKHMSRHAILRPLELVTSSKRCHLVKIHSNKKVAIFHYTSTFEDNLLAIGAYCMHQRACFSWHLGILSNFCFKGFVQKCP